MSPYSSEQLNFFKFSTIVLDEFPVALRQVFVYMWDKQVASTPDLQKWDDSPLVRNMFLRKEGGKTKYVPTNKSYMEWDCTALFQATLYAQSFAMPDGKGGLATLDQLYVKPRRLPNGEFHHSVSSPSGKQDETFAVALDQLRLLRNNFCHQLSTREIDKASFNYYILLTKDAFVALGHPVTKIVDLEKLDGEDFSISRLKELKDKLKFKHNQMESMPKYVWSEVRDVKTRATDVTKKMNIGSEAKDWKADIGGKKGEMLAERAQETMKSSRTQNKSFARTAVAIVGGRLKTYLGYFQQREIQTVRFSKEEELDTITEISGVHANQEEDVQLVDIENRVNRKVLESFQRSVNHEFSEIIVRNLDEAINFYQSDCIVPARAKLQDVFKLVQKVGTKTFGIPTRYGWQVSNRGKELFFEENVNCSLKHGTIILDSSNAGAQFYASLLDILGAFSTQVSEFKIAKETFSILIALHAGTSKATSRLRDLAAAYNNRGCLSLIMGEFDQAGSDLNTSLTHLKCEKRKQPSTVRTEAMFIGINSNISRLDLMSRNFTKGLEGQEQLVEICKTKVYELPLQTTFMVMHNQAVLHVTLDNMAKAEEELKWLIMYCKGTRREKCDVLLNFVSLQLCEVLLLRGKPDEAEQVYALESLTSERVQEMMPTFINSNVRIEEFEKKIDVLVQRRKLKFARERVQKGIELVKKSFGADHFNVASLLYKEGSILKLMGDIRGSLEKFKCSAKILRDIFDKKHPLLIKCYMSLGAIAFRLGRTDESHLYFQRAMENVEIIHQVSFPNQLSMKFIKMTKNPKHAQFGGLQGRNTQEQMIEGLVAEHGEALAVLLLRLHLKKKQPFRGTRNKGKQPLVGKMLNVRCTESVLIVSQKVVRDLLLSGQTLLRHGMKKEAVAFFQQASKHCQAYHTAQSHCCASLIRLYNVISQKSLKSKDKLEKNRALNSYLEELKEDIANNGIEDGSERKSEDTEKLALDSQLTLKLVLIFLILFSMQLQMHDTTYAAYDLYTNLSPNDNRFFLTVNDELQVYASRASVVCNGKTAVQDVLVCPAIGVEKTDPECYLSGKPLFRNLSYKNNMPTYSFLAISSSPVFLDVDDVKQLEEKLLRSFQEYLQIKCLDNPCDVATQIVVDLTATSFCEQNIFSRIELLPLCLSEEVGAEEVHEKGRNISVIYAGLCEKITCMTFADEPASCFMFGRIALWLLQGGKWGTMSTLKVQHQCLVLTVVDPVKARITLWYEDMSIKQKVQVISSAKGIHPSGWIGTRRPSCEDLMGNSRHCCKEIEQFFVPAIMHWANTHDVRCEVNVVRRQCSYSVKPQIVLDESCEPDSFHLNGLQPKNTFSQISREENEESVRKSLKVSTLECLTAISELSRQLYGNAIQEDEIAVHPNLTETDRMSSLPNEDTTCNPLDQDATSSRLAEDTIFSNFSQPTFNRESDPERRKLSKITTEADRLTLKERDNIKDNDDAIVFGREQFEEERKSRISSIAKLQEDLKKTGMWRKMTPLEGGDESVNYTSENNVSSAGETTRGESYPHGSGESTVCGTQKTEECGESDEEKDEHCKGSCEDRQIFKEKQSTGVPPTRKEEKEENDSKPLNDSGSQKASEEILNETIETAMVNILPNTGAANPILNEASGFFENKTETGFSNRIQKQHGKVNNIEMDSGETFQDKDVIVNNHKIESVTPKNNNTFQRNFRKNHHTTAEKDCKPHFQDGEEALQHGPRAQNITNFSVAELPMERNYPSFEVGVWNSGRCKEHDRRNGPNQIATKKEEHEKQQLLHTIDVPYKDNLKKSIRSTFLGGDVVADGCTTDRILQRTQDVVDGPDSYHSKEEHNKDRCMFLAGSEVAADVCIRHASPQATQDGPALFHTNQVHSKDRMATSVQSPFLGGNVVADGYATGALPKTTPNGINGSALTTENCLSGYSTMEGMGLNEGNAFKSKKSLDEVKRTNDLELIRNRGPSSFESEDVVDGPSKPPKDSKNVKCISPDFSGSKPTQRFHKTARKSSASTSFMDPISTQQFKESPLGLDPNFVARHAVINSSPTSSFHNLTDNGATWEDPPEVAFDEQGACSNVHSSLSLNMFGKRSPWKSYKPYGSGFSANEAIAGGCSIQGSLHSRIIHQATPPRKDESWHFPPLPTHFSDVHECGTQQNSSEFNRPLFDFPKSRGAYNDLVSMTNEFYNRNNSYGEIPLYSAVSSQEVSLARSESQQNSTEDVSASLLARLKETMARTVSLIASIDASGKQAKPEQKPVEKVGIQEQASDEGETEHGAEATEVNSTEQVTPLPRNEQTVDMEREDRTTPVQESPRPACGHYQRRCLVKFPCCGRFYPCHRCHNESKACSDDQARAINATHMRCTICYHEQLIDEGSRKCGGCNSKMSDYFCATCKHFTSVDKNPFHCEKCGICRIHSDKSFHCDVCNVCLDKRLQGKHKCRPDSGHDECCICLEDAFSGCQILPCSHKVHKDCAIAMIQNGVRTCPICRHPLFQQPEGTQ